MAAALDSSKRLVGSTLRAHRYTPSIISLCVDSLDHLQRWQTAVSGSSHWQRSTFNDLFNHDATNEIDVAQRWIVSFGKELDLQNDVDAFTKLLDTQGLADQPLVALLANALIRFPRLLLETFKVVAFCTEAASYSLLNVSGGMHSSVPIRQHSSAQPKALHLQSAKQEAVEALLPVADERHGLGREHVGGSDSHYPPSAFRSHNTRSFRTSPLSPATLGGHPTAGSMNHSRGVSRDISSTGPHHDSHESNPNVLGEGAPPADQNSTLATDSRAVRELNSAFSSLNQFVTRAKGIITEDVDFSDYVNSLQNAAHILHSASQIRSYAAYLELIQSWTRDLISFHSGEQLIQTFINNAKFNLYRTLNESDLTEGEKADVEKAFSNLLQSEVRSIMAKNPELMAELGQIRDLQKQLIDSDIPQEIKGIDRQVIVLEKLAQELNGSVSDFVNGDFSFTRVAQSDVYQDILDRIYSPGMKQALADITYLESKQAAFANSPDLKTLSTEDHQWQSTKELLGVLDGHLTEAFKGNDMQALAQKLRTFRTQIDKLYAKLKVEVEDDIATIKADRDGLNSTVIINNKRAIEEQVEILKDVDSDTSALISYADELAGSSPQLKAGYNDVKSLVRDEHDVSQLISYANKNELFPNLGSDVEHLRALVRDSMRIITISTDNSLFAATEESIHEDVEAVRTITDAVREHWGTFMTYLRGMVAGLIDWLRGILVRA